jgi:1,4-dihydroxy-2-naphthoyl-CoA synthase
MQKKAKKAARKSTKDLTLSVWRKTYEAHTAEYLEAVNAVIKAADRVEAAKKMMNDAMAESAAAGRAFQEALEELKRVADYR